MKKFKLISIIGLLTCFVSLGFSDDGPDDLKVDALGHQIKDEIVDVMNLPVYLNFTDKNLNGLAEVLIHVGENGKITLLKINGENELLNHYIEHKISSKNMWTDTKYNNTIFRYIINFKQGTS